MSTSYVIPIVAAVVVVVVLSPAVIRLVRGPAARIVIDGADLTVRLGVIDKLLALHGDVRVPLAGVRQVEVADQPRRYLTGRMRAPGTAIPGVLAYGTYRGAGQPDFAALVGRAPALVITSGDGASFDRLVVSVPDPAASAAIIRQALR